MENHLFIEVMNWLDNSERVSFDDQGLWAFDGDTWTHIASQEELVEDELDPVSLYEYLRDQLDQSEADEMWEKVEMTRGE